jgi:predicted dehydrogenase
MSESLKVAVIGVGHLGKWHAEKFAASKDCELIAIVDSNLEAAQAITRSSITLMPSVWSYQQVCIIKSVTNYWKQEFTV